MNLSFALCLFQLSLVTWFIGQVHCESQSELNIENDIVDHQMVLAKYEAPIPPQCYGDDLGCFECTGPMQAVMKRCFPEPPQDVNTTFYVYDRFQPEKPRFQLNYKQLNNLGPMLNRTMGH